MKDILAKLLYVILALVILVCAFIGLCEINPALAKPFKDYAAKVEAEKQRKADELAAEEAAKEAEKAAAAAAESAEEVASLEASVEAVLQAAEGTSEEDTEPETEHPYDFELTYDDYVAQWDNTVISEDYLEDPDYTDFVTALLNSLDEEEGSEYPEDRSHMLTPQPEIFIIEDDEQAKQIMDSIDYGETGEGLEFDELYYPYYHMLNDRGQALYRQFYANADALKTKFAPIVDKATDNEVESAFICLLNDHPELFWVDITYYFQYDYKGHVIEFDLSFYKNFPNIPSSRQKFESRAKELAAGAEGLKTAYEKELYVHDALVDKLNYQYNNLDQSAYSSVVLDNTVCAGYTRAFQYIMQLLEVPTYNCYGWGGGERHAWNIIKLDDGFHNVDVTWDDSLSNYEYFNLSDAENDGHRRMDFAIYLPRCGTSKYKPASKDKDTNTTNTTDTTGKTDQTTDVKVNTTTKTNDTKTSDSAAEASSEGWWEKYRYNKRK